jgi:hypothetical protein
MNDYRTSGKQIRMSLIEGDKMQKLMAVPARSSRCRPYALAAMAKRIRRMGMAAAKVGVISAAAAGTVAFVGAPPASAAILKPASRPYVVALNAKGDPEPFTIRASGYEPQEPVYLEICDGGPATEAGWSPTVDCDGTTSGAAVAANGQGVATFAVGGQSEVLLFRGASPTRSFNCLAPADINRAATPKAGMGNVVPSAHRTYPPADDAGYNAGEPKPLAADPAIPSWDDCQVRIASTDEVATTDQQFVGITLGGALLSATVTKKSTSSLSPAVVVPIGVAAVILGGGLVYSRRRRHARLTV